MSRIENFCECSMPNRAKFCVMYCGKPRHPSADLIIFDSEGTVKENQWDMLDRTIKEDLAAERVRRQYLRKVEGDES